MENDDFKTMLFDGKVMKAMAPEKPLKEGQYSIGDFSFTISEENCLGKGGCASVYKGKSLSKEPI